jgi:hypothetical protein
VYSEGMMDGEGSKELPPEAKDIGERGEVPVVATGNAQEGGDTVSSINSQNSEEVTVTAPMQSGEKGKDEPEQEGVVVSEEDLKTILGEQLLKDKVAAGFGTDSDEYKKLKEEIDNPETTLNKLKKRIGEGNDALLAILEKTSKDNTKRDEKYQEDYGNSIRSEVDETVPLDESQANSLRDLNEAQINLPAAAERFLGKDGLIESGVKAQVLGQIDDEVRTKYIEGLKLTDPTFAALSPEEQQKFIKSHREHVDQVHALIEQEKGKTLGERIKEGKEELLKSTDLEQSLQLMTGKKDVTKEKDSFLKSLAKYGLAWMYDEVTHSIKANNFEEFLNFLFHPTAYGTSGGMQFKENEAERGDVIGLTEFRRKIEKPLIFGDALKKGLQLTRLNTGQPGLAENNFKLQSTDKMSKDQILEGLGKGDREAIHLAMKSLFTFIFEDESKRSERWELVRTAIGQGIFPEKKKKLAAEIGNFFKMMKENPDEFKRYFPVPDRAQTPTVEAEPEPQPDTKPVTTPEVIAP